MGVEDLLAGPQHLHGPSRATRQERDAELEREGVRLAAERSSQAGLDDADLRGAHAQHVGQRTVHVVGDLGRGPERQHPLGRDLGNRTVGLDRRVGRAVEAVVGFDHLVRILEALVHVPEGQLDVLGYVAALGLLGRLVDLGLPVGQGLFRLEEGGQDLVVDLDQLQRAVRRVLVHRSHGGHLVPDEAHLVEGQGVLVRSPGDHPVLGGQVLAGDDRVDALQREGAAGVDPADPRVGVGAPQALGVQHPGQGDVVGVDRLPRRLGQTVDLARRGADDLEAARQLARGRAVALVFLRSVGRGPGRLDAVDVACAHRLASDPRSFPPSSPLSSGSCHGQSAAQEGAGADSPASSATHRETAWRIWV